MKASIDHNLLLKFLKKETTTKENQEIKNWVSASEKNREEFRDIHETFHLSQLKQYKSEIDIEKAWNKLYDQLPNQRNHKHKIQTLFWQVAASIAIIMAVGISSFWMGGRFSTQENSKLVQVETPAGEKSKILLPDGTYVWLNSSSLLSYDAGDPRKVKVDGEAYFEVAKDKKHPFEVSTPSGMKVTVLGTKFNLRYYNSENKVETTLDEGQIVISGVEKYKPLILHPGQQADYSLANGKLTVREVDTSIFSLWRNNVLRFDDVSFAELVPRIERWYGVSIDVDPKISHTDRFTMTVKTESLRELLNMMQLTSIFNYEIKGENVKITAR